MKKPFNWDNYSDQPVPIKDKIFKKKMRKKELFSLMKTFFLAILILPLSIVLTPFVRRKKIDSSLFLCMGIDYQREPSLSIEMIDELKVKRILLRVKLWELESLDELKEFISKIKEKKTDLFEKYQVIYFYLAIFWSIGFVFIRFTIFSMYSI